MRALQAFEASARHGSFTGAAEELGISATAVGQLVRSLEDWIGRPLFRRARAGRERLTLTEHSTEALLDIGKGLDALETGQARLKGSGARSIVLVTASQALAANWLIFLLDGFTRRHPDIDVRLDVSDRLVDVAHGEADIGVRCGPGHWKGLQATRLMDEEVIAVASPELVRSSRSEGCAFEFPLIQDATVYDGGGFPDWAQWSARFGVLHSSDRLGISINSTSAVIRAAIAGQGAALVRRLLVTNDLATGRLVELGSGHRWPIEWAYYVVARPEALRRKEVQAFHSWLVEQAGTKRPA